MKCTNKTCVYYRTINENKSRCGVMLINYLKHCKSRKKWVKFTNQIKKKMVKTEFEYLLEIL